MNKYDQAIKLKDSLRATLTLGKEIAGEHVGVGAMETFKRAISELEDFNFGATPLSDVALKEGRTYILAELDRTNKSQVAHAEHVLKIMEAAMSEQGE